MIEAYNSTLPYRVGFAVVFFVVLGARDWIKNPENPTRVREYLFLVASMLLSIVYGLIHDHITATISPEYFLKAKGLESDPQPFRIAVTWLAIKATYGPGVLAGALMLIANNPPSNNSYNNSAKKSLFKKPQLAYRRMLRICIFPIVGAAVCATLGGALCVAFGARTWFADAALAYTTSERVTPFLAVCGIHAGSYVGAIAGSVLAVVCVVRARNALA